MKKLFNASLIAAAVAGSFAVNAATISSDTLKFSAEGVAAGFTETASDLVVDVVVVKDHPASSWITVDFGDKADLSGLTLKATVGNAPGSGTGDGGDVQFDYGNGSFTFDNLELVGETGKETGIKFQVNLGNKLAADSAFRITVGNTAKPVLKGAGSLTYISKDVTETNTIETGTAIWGEEKPQLAASVTTKFDNRIEREVQETFATFDTPAESDKKDVAVFKLVNDTTLLAPITLDSVTVNAGGDFGAGAVISEFVWSNAIATNPDDIAGPAFDAGKDHVVTTVTPDTTAANGHVVSDTYTLTFTNDGTAKAIEVSDFDIDVIGNYDNKAGTAVKQNLLAEADLGEWALDASVVNVPYLPVGYSHLKGAVEYSNHGSKAAAVMITAFDQFGNEWSGELADAPAEQMTQYGFTAIQDALGLDKSKGYKLNITFISDADEEDVSIVPYYRENDSRVQSINDQYKKNFN